MMTSRHLSPDSREPAMDTLPARDLYGAAVTALVAARDLSAAAASPGATPAIGAALAPLESTLGELERAARAIEMVARERLLTASLTLGGRWQWEHTRRTLREFEDLTRALRAAHWASITARDYAGPVLAELTRI